MNAEPNSSEPKPNEPDPGLDSKLKEAQLAKLHREIQQLERSRWSFDTVSRVTVAVLAVAAAGFAVYNGIPQARLDLYDAQTRLSRIREELDAKTDNINAKLAEIESLEKIITARSNELGQLQTMISRIKTQDPRSQQEIAAASKPRVFIQFAGALARSQVDKLRQVLGTEGFNAPPAERINQGQRNEVRYFAQTDAERALAERVKTATQAVFREANCPIDDLAVTFVNIQGRTQSPIEVWLMHSCRSG